MTPEEMFYRSVKEAPAHDGAVMVETGFWVFGILAVLVLCLFLRGLLRD